MNLFWGRKASIDLSKKGSSGWTSILRSGLTLVITCAALLSLIVAIHFYRETVNLRASAIRAPSVADAAEDPAAQTIVAVEKHFMLPQGEQPKIARVTSLQPLANIPFFGNALVGDVVLVYCKTSLSVLYSPSRDKVIEVSRQLVGGSCTK